MSTAAENLLPVPPPAVGENGVVGSATAGEQGYSIDELATASGASPRTIRFYRHYGLVRPPRKEGRRAFYDPSELDRLRTIIALRERGFGLDAIAKILDDPQNAQSSLALVLELSDELRQPWIDDRAATMTELEVLERVGVADESLIEMLEAVNAVQRTTAHPASFHVPSVAVLEITGDLLAAGIAPEVCVAGWQLMRRHLGALVRDLVTRFTESAGEGNDAPFTLDELTGAYADLRPIAMRALEVTFAHQMQDALATFVEQGGVFELPTRDRR